MNGSSALLRWVLVSGQAWEESDRTKGRRAWPTPCTPALLPHGMGAAWKEQTQGKGPAWSAAPWRGGGASGLLSQYMFNNKRQSHPGMDSAASRGVNLSRRKEAGRLQRRDLCPAAKQALSRVPAHESP